MRTTASSMMELAFASWETIIHRMVMMATGTCSAAEYKCMVSEKMAASHASMVELMAGGGGVAVIAPYLAAASGNAKRLRG